MSLDDNVKWWWSNTQRSVGYAWGAAWEGIQTIKWAIVVMTSIWSIIDLVTSVPSTSEFGPAAIVILSALVACLVAMAVWGFLLLITLPLGYARIFIAERMMERKLQSQQVKKSKTKAMDLFGLEDDGV